MISYLIILFSAIVFADRSEKGFIKLFDWAPSFFEWILKAVLFWQLSFSQQNSSVDFWLYILFCETLSTNLINKGAVGFRVGTKNFLRRLCHRENLCYRVITFYFLILSTFIFSIYCKKNHKSYVPCSHLVSSCLCHKCYFIILRFKATCFQKVAWFFS